AGPVGVKVGGIEKIAARLTERLIDPSAIVLRRAPTPVFTEGHCAQAHLGYAKPTIAQQSVSQSVILPATSSRHAKRAGQSLIRGSTKGSACQAGDRGAMRCERLRTACLRNLLRPGSGIAGAPSMP